MPEIIMPAVWVEEIPPLPLISALPGDIAAFVGVAERLPTAPPDSGPIASPITGPLDFERAWSVAATLAGGTPNHLWPAVQGFFANGGRRLHIAPVSPAAPTLPAYHAAIAALADTDAALLAAPDARLLLAPADADAVMAALVACAAAPAVNRLALLDAPADLDIDGVLAWRAPWDSPDAALYWPWLVPAAQAPPVPTSAIIAGVIARSEIDRGLWKAPANIAVHGVAGPVLALNDRDQDRLNPEHVNAIRAFPGRGLLVWGTRTLSRDPAWRHVPVRRLVRMVEASLVRGLEWTVFEPADPRLWARVRQSAENFLAALWRAGALAGARPDEAWFVRCDTTTMTAADIAAGRLVVEIGIAPLRPGEFQLLRITSNGLPA